MSPSDGGPGRVYLVGAGPGDPGLLTARALELIAVADVILYDRLIPAAALDVARPEAELVFVGKEGTGESVPQEQTEQLMLARARSGRTVVRLKGGDPFVFGRGGEEALALRAASIPYEIVPGVSAGVAAPAYAGIPVTHRGSASAVALVTGHEDPAKDESAIDWPALAAFPGTLVFYMGARRLGELAQALLAAGRDPAQPAAVIEAGTLPEQRTITATLQTIAQRAGEEGVGAPAITVIGPVAALAGELSWLPERPLHGVSVAVTRARAQGSALAARLAQLGARTVQAPVIETVPLPGEIPDLRGYDLICMTSPVGVAQLVQRLLADGRDARALAGARVAAIGAGTAEALRERGVLADVIPRRAVAEGLVEELAASELPVRRALIARAREGRELLAQALRERGAEVDVLALYETVARPLSERVLAAVRAADYVTFTSSSTVRFFLRAAGGEAGLSPSTRVVSIGPVTSETLREHGLEPHVEAETHDVQGVIDAVVEDAAAPS
ncbi:MAG TPA: uroporphyrinogen-III C-methyltransferase [Solirubrobacteraceae bacterium]|nr:uroporphyrinogen-III C-methyltransferase [Solirubrobacteraceae bacterium]